MKKLNTLLLFVLPFIVVGCFRFCPKNLTNNAYEEIEDVSIRLIYRHSTDTLVKTNYERTYNLPGNECPKIETTLDFDTITKLGVAIRFWTKIAGLRNRAMIAKGVQIALFNKSSDMRGIQIGLWNMNGKRSLPLINWQFKPSTASV